MALTDRPHSLNTYCLSKVWFRCSSINLRVCDLTKISSNIKSWLFADQLEKPEEVVLYRPRECGGLGLLNVQFKAISLSIRSFLETAIIPNFQHNLLHVSLYLWHVEGRRDIVCPTKTPNYDANFFGYIREVKEEGLLNIKTMTSGMWYKVLLENHVTDEVTNSGRRLRPCRAELKHPDIEWEIVWRRALTRGLPSHHLTFLWQMLHDLLPSQERLFRLKMPNGMSNLCTLCDENLIGNLTHSLILCPYNNGAGHFLLDLLHQLIPNLLPQQVVLLDLDVDDDHQLPLVYLVSSVLSQIWSCRKEKKPCHLGSIRATLEAGINIMRKSRYWKAANILCDIVNIA